LTSAIAAEDIKPGFIVLQGNRLEGLRDLLVEWLRRYPLAPLENETVLVQSNGMAQWLRLALARDGDDEAGGLGIATAMDMLLPARLQWLCYRAVMGTDRVPPEAPLDKPRLTWRLLRILQQQDDDPRFDQLRHYIEGDSHRAYLLAARLADQFDQYQVYRADWLADWAGGHERLRDALGRDEAAVPEVSAWQPALWRAVLDDLRDHPPVSPDDIQPEGPGALDHAGRALIHQAFLRQIEQRDERPPGLPRRIVVFGISALPPQVLEVLGAVSRWVQVIFCLQNPCQHYWGDIVEDRHLFHGQYRRLSARKLPEQFELEDLHQHAHPLLASWGKQGRDLVRLVDAFDDTPEITGQAAEPLKIDLFDPPTHRHLLARIQADLLDLTPMREIEDEERLLDPDDRSIAFTVAHSPLREVEILHDQLLAAFDADPTLQPRDVIVMVPDMADYAAAISAVFGRLDRDDPRHLPYAVSDRPERELHPMLRALDRLMRLPESRLTASEVIDLLDVAALRARFGLGADDVEILRHWIEAAGIRWGLDADHRHDFGLPEGIDQNSWAFGLDRLLYAYLGGAEGRWHDIVPVAGLDGMSAALVGALYQLVESLGHWRQRLLESHTPAQWAAIFAELLADFFDVETIPGNPESGTNPLAERESATSLRDRILDAANDWLADCDSAAFELPVTLETARSAWLDRLDTHRLSQRFMVGAINFATLMPMRAIPFRQVYLLGMDDRSYPRRQPVADFDLMARRYRPGDRSRREDDRYLFLESLLSARDRLSISWVGRSIRNNQKYPASVLVNQLRDHINQGWRIDGAERPPADHLTTEHPLQPFSRRYFSDAEPELFSYAGEWQRVYQEVVPTLTSDATDHEQAEPATIPTLADLGQLLKRPWRVYLGRHLDIPGRFELRLPEDDEPFELDSLMDYGLSSRLLDNVLDHVVSLSPDARLPENLHDALPGMIDRAFDRIAGSGALPLHPFDGPLRERHGEVLMRQMQTWSALVERYPATVAPFALPDDLDVGGQIADIRLGESADEDEPAAVRLRLVPGRLHSAKELKWHRLLTEWPAHLAAQLCGRPVATFLISESDAHEEALSRRPTVFEPLDADTARRLLQQLAEWWRQAIARPLPAEPRTQIPWLLIENDVVRRAKAIEGFERASGYDPELLRLWPDADRLLAHPDFDVVARTLYLPLLLGTRGAHRDGLENTAAAEVNR